MKKVVIVLISLTFLLTAVGCKNDAPNKEPSPDIPSPEVQPDTSLPTITNISDLVSEDESLSVGLKVNDGSLYYNISNSNLSTTDKTVLTDSRAQLLFNEFGDKGYRVVGVEDSAGDDSWEMVIGQTSNVDGKYTQKILTLETLDTKTTVKVIFRLFNTGLGIRYVVPKQSGVSSITVLKDETEFVFPKDGLAMESWPGSKTGVVQTTPLNVSDFKALSGHIPVTVNFGSASYVSIAHADNIEQESMYVRNTTPFHEGGVYKLSVESHGAKAHTEFTSAWNTITVTETADELLNSHLIQTLNPECTFEDTSWIRGGNSTWDWRNNGATVNKGTDDEYTYGLNNDSFDKYIEFASQNSGFRGVMIDDFWYQGRFEGSESDPTKEDNGGADPGDKTLQINVNLETIGKKCVDNNLDFWIYVNDVDLIGYEEDIPNFYGEKNMVNVKERVGRILDKYKEWGAVGIKLGFVIVANPSGQTNFDITDAPGYFKFLLEELAAREMMLDMHESIQPFGLERTYPNLLASEYVIAQFDRPFNYDLTPEQIMHIPFTNNLITPLDRAPGQFDFVTYRSKGSKEATTTVASQLAQLINIYGGVVSLPDNPHGYNAKSDLLEFINAMPAGNGSDGELRAGAWEESKVLHYVLGNSWNNKRYCTIARRAGNEWFVGTINGGVANDISINLAFLPAGSYKVTMYVDGDDAHGTTNKESYKIISGVYTNTQSVRIQAKEGGGGVLHITPIN